MTYAEEDSLALDIYKIDSEIIKLKNKKELTVEEDIQLNELMLQKHRLIRSANGV